MKRDMDLIRQLLMFSEANCKGNDGAFLKFSEFGHSDDQESLRAHIDLMEEAGLLKEALPSWEDDVGVGSLTWDGHDFLNSVRDPKVWRKTKEIAQKAGGWTASTLAEIAKSIATGAATALLSGGA